MSNKGTKRFEYIDIAKGIAIIAVVLGHCFPSNIYTNKFSVSNIIATLIYDFVYLWHMPLFFFLSGKLFFSTWNGHRLASIKKRAYRLLVPYFSFSIVYIPLRVFLSGLANSQYDDYWKILIGISPNGGMWYLYVLFIFVLFSILIIRNKTVLEIMIIVFSITNVIVNFGIQIDYSVLKYFFAFFVFFLIGIFSNYDIELNARKLIDKFIAIKLVVFVLLFFIQEYFHIKSLSILSSLIGINLVIVFSMFIHSRMIRKIGEMSMEIYLLHGPILVVLRTVLSRINIPNLLVSAIMFICAMFFSVLLGKYVLHMNRFFEFIFLGICNKERKE